MVPAKLAKLTEAMANQQAVAAFASFVRAEQELLTNLQGWVERDKPMLSEMRGSGAA